MSFEFSKRNQERLDVEGIQVVTEDGLIRLNFWKDDVEPVAYIIMSVPQASHVADEVIQAIAHLASLHLGLD